MEPDRGGPRISRRQWLGQAVLLLLGGSLLTFADRPIALHGQQGERARPCSRLEGRTIAWIVPHAPGGGHDTYARLIAFHLERELAAKIVVKNLPASGGLIGANAINAARPDGTTIGLISGSGMLAASLAGEKRAPNPTTAFTVLGRVAGSEQVWATGRDSPLRTMEDIVAESQKRPIVFATRDVGGLSFVTITLASHLLGLPIKVVPGYAGTSAGVLAALRGEVDLVSYDFDTIYGSINSGDLRPLLQISLAQDSRNPTLTGVPVLGGRDGVAARRAESQGRTVDDMVAEAAALVDLVDAGRLIVAPPEMEPALALCLEKALMTTLHDPAFRSSAERARLSLDVANGADARRRLVSAARHLDRFGPIINAAIEELRL